MENTQNEAVNFGDLWRIQESLLQAYRAIFVTFESVIIAVEAFLLSSNQPPILIGIPVMLLGLGLIPIWMGVCNARANAVVFIHWLIQKHESGEYVIKPYSHFRQFQKNRMYKDQNVVEDENYINLSKSKTRNRMDVVVPLMFASMWVLLFIIVFLSRLV